MSIMAHTRFENGEVILTSHTANDGHLTSELVNAAAETEKEAEVRRLYEEYVVAWGEWMKARVDYEVAHALYNSNPTEERRRADADAWAKLLDAERAVNAAFEAYTKAKAEL